ncbi:hypothetical protein PWT90_08861 [Aphanocladium album]|nr:hypothetical protein PWT90_08861 [Aphanocladium album]
MPVKAVFFDFMGTCLDWHGSIAQALPAAFPRTSASSFALQWRRLYFLSNKARLERGLAPEDIDVTLDRTLSALVADHFAEHASLFADEPAARQRLIRSWHTQRAWPDVAAAMARIRSEPGGGGNSSGLELFVHGNGTTRLQLDLVRASGLGEHFAMLFSSELLGVYKPDRRAYEKALELVRVRPEEVVMVAAHAYDLRGAKEVGMKTVYIRRWTDDIDEDMEQVLREVDVFLENMDTLPETIAKFA